MNEQIIIDTDPGIDDTLAFVYSNNALLPVIAISTVYGNVSLRNVTRNAGYIVKSLSNDWKIYTGSDRPLSGSAHLAESHGASGLGTLEPQDSEIIKPTGTYTELLSKLKAKAKNTIFCLGPLTNLVHALNNPEFARNIDTLIIMGGAFSEEGNVTSYAEFNTYNDPEAFQIVMDQAMIRGINTIIIPAEVCRKVLLTKHDLEALDGKIPLQAIRQIVEPFIDYYMNDDSHGGYNGAVLYDVLVPLYYEHPDLFKAEPSRVNVELRNKTKRGQTVAKPEAGSPIKVCSDINAYEAKKIIMSTLARF